MRNDLRYALRNLLSTPGFALVTTAVLALGIGVNTAIFGLLASVLAGNAPGIAAPERLVVFSRTGEGLGFGHFSYPDYCDYRDRSQSFSGLMAYQHTDFSLGGVDEPEQLRGAAVSNNYFSVLGAGAFFGPGTQHAVVVSHRLWQRRFRGDPGLVGKAIRLNGRPYTVAGIAPAAFRGTELDEPLDVWTPIDLDAAAPRPDPFSDPHERSDAFLNIAGRLKPGVRFQQAQAEAATIGRQLQSAYPRAYSEKTKRSGVILDRNTTLGPLSRGIAGGVLLVLLIAAGFVLLIACVNIATMLLARALGRRREIAVRLALGATRTRLVRQLVTESLVLSVAGGVAGLLVAIWAGRLVPLIAKDLNFLDPRLDFRMLCFSALVSIATGLLFGLAPALESSRRDLALELKAGGTAPVSRSRLRSLLTVSEIALSLMLLIGAGLLVRSYLNVRTQEMGFVSQNVLLMSIDPERLGYNDARRQELYRDLYARLNGMPGVAAATLAGKTVASGGFTSRYLLDGVAPARENAFEVRDDAVAPRYFETLQIPLRAGRDFTERDTRGAPGAAIVNEALAARLWPGENPLGKRLRRWGFGVGPPLEVVGVARNVRLTQDFDPKPAPYLYLPLFQNERGHVRLHIRAAGNAGGLAPRVRREIRALDQDLPVFDVETLERHLHNEFSLLWSLAALVGAFGILAAALAAIGLYGVMSYAVGQRTREIGVRMALGAQRVDVLAMVLRQSMTLVAAGLAAGVLGALALTRLLREALYGLTPTDPKTYAGVSLLFVTVALGAAYLPARRAARIDPVTALRHE
jgi:predicted permease